MKLEGKKILYRRKDDKDNIVFSEGYVQEEQGEFIRIADRQYSYSSWWFKKSDIEFHQIKTD